MRDLVAPLECFPMIDRFNLSLEEEFEGIYIIYVIFQPSTLIFFILQ